MKCRSSQDNCIKQQQLLFPIGHTTLTTVHCTTTRGVNGTSWKFSQYSERAPIQNLQYTMPNECLNSVLRFREMSLTALTSALLLRRAHIKSDSSQHKLFDKTVSAVIYHHGLASHRRCRGELTNHLPHQSQSSYTYKRNQQTNQTLLRHGAGSFFTILKRVLNASAGKNTIHIIEHWIKVRMDILNNFIFIRKKCITSTFILVKKLHICSR